MKWWIAAIAAVTVLAGCHSTTTYVKSTRPPSSSTVAASTPDSATQDKVFFSELLQDRSFDSEDRSKLVDLARTMCGRLDERPDDKAKVISILMDNGFSLGQASTFTVAAVTAYCPEHLAQVR